jgi:hypothetical protein
MKLGPRRTAQVLVAVACVSALLAGCIRRPGGGGQVAAWAACLAGDRISDPADLAGEYELTLYATSGPNVARTATGRLLLHRQSDDLRGVPGVDGTPMAGAWMPLYGTADVTLHRVGAAAAGGILDVDPEAPGVGVYAQASDVAGVAPQLTLRLGVEANRRGQIRFDGTYMSLLVREWGSTGIAGEWASGEVEGEVASGRFCATRISTGS